MAIVNIFQFKVFTQPDPKSPGDIIVNVQPGAHGLFSGGVILDMAIGVDSVTAQAMQSQGLTVPTPVVIKALLDTGCTVTSIDAGLVTTLGLKTNGFTKTATANGIATTSQHSISLAFPGTKLSGKTLHEVQSVNLKGQPFAALIGRDLMSRWNISYNGSTGFVSIGD